MRGVGGVGDGEIERIEERREEGEGKEEWRERISIIDSETVALV